ncbi:hypothetical protein [Celerinatantimonas yamalensis]|uniref:Uncharacterized protein n=1 Tax=Celerinatantimonas yamalensis TaxID=559956 RepID=A0ABW9G8D9_9GAMM
MNTQVSQKGINNLNLGELTHFNFDFGESTHNTEPSSQCYDMSKYIGFITSVEDENAAIEHNTNLMLTKFRKLYYDSFGWNEFLIPETSHVATFPQSQSTQNIKHSHQVNLTNNDLYDVAHIFAILDANNHNGPFTPVPESIINSSYWNDLKDIVPVVQDRLMAAGWLGDLSEITGEIFLNRKDISKLQKDQKNEEKQKIINQFGAYYKTLANVDGMIMAGNATNNQYEGKKVSEIFESFYGGGSLPGERSQLKSSIYLKYGESIGLQNWNGHCFENSEDWLKKQKSNLQTCTAFYVMKKIGLDNTTTTQQIDLESLQCDLKRFSESLTEQDKRKGFVSQALNDEINQTSSIGKIPSIIKTCVLIWNGFYNHVMSLDSILSSYLDGLSQAIINTQKAN